MYIEVQSLEAFDKLLKENEAILGYFSNKQCGVCKVLKPQIDEMLQKHFPKIKPVYIDIELVSELAAQHSVFTIPTVILYLEGKETLRKSRHVGLEELRGLIERPYKIMFT